MQNVLHHDRSSSYLYCFCDKFEGCAVGRFTPKTIFCSICQIQYDFETNFSEKIKYNSKRSLSFASDLCGVMNVNLSDVNIKKALKVE